MSSLTLAQRLKIPIARVMQVTELGDSEANNLIKPCTPNAFISKKTLEYTIPSMQLTASKYNFASLSANQVELDSKVLVMHKSLLPHKWEDYESRPDDYIIFINPKITSKKTPAETEDGWERCPSLPEIEALCKRQKSIDLAYQNPAGEWEESSFTGFEARVLQHEIDHLNGQLMIHPNISFGRVKSDNEKVQKVIKWFHEECNRRKAIIEDLLTRSQALREKMEESGMSSEEMFTGVTFTPAFTYRFFVEIGDSFWARESFSEPLKDLDFTNFVSGVEEDLKEKSPRIGNRLRIK